MAGWRPFPGPTAAELTGARYARYTGVIPRMSASRNRVSRFLTDSRPQGEALFHPLSNFYREEFVKCQRCLEQQREYYSERTISDVEQALTRAMSQIDRLCTKGDADKVVSRLLRQFDVVTGLSAWSDPRHVH